MRLIQKFKLSVLLVILALGASAQQVHFRDAQERSFDLGNSKRVIIPQKYRAVSADLILLRNFLGSLPLESGVNRSEAPVLVLPLPDGSTGRFRVWESPIMEPALQAKFPEIRTYAGQGIDDPYATIRFDYSPYFGFHAQILSPGGNIYIDPYARGNIDHYISYYDDDNIRSAPFTCIDPEGSAPVEASRPDGMNAGPCRGGQLYTYRLAVACTGEYAVAVGGTSPGALHSAIVTTVNRVTGVYETELAIRLILVANNDLVEYMNASSDPFTGNNSPGTLIVESQTVITANIGTANFDIGHTFSTGGGGFAGLGVVCSPSQKARGITGNSNPVGDSYDIDYVAHEMGHQFGGNHTFNSQTSSCNGNRTAVTAYEVGSGTTIQAYAGICGSDNIQLNSDPYFHAISFDQISNFVEAGGGTCKGVILTGNNLPQITSMNNNNANIPLGTPFTLTGSATDADGDALTYSWEQWDLGGAGSWNSGASSTTAPLFKSRRPKSTGSRTFPDMAVILAGYPANPPAAMNGLKGETLPTVARAMKFRLTVRDNRAGGGGVVSGGEGCQAGFTGTFQINTIAGTGPFMVTVPNGGESYPGATFQTVTWNVAGSDAAPINCATVRILLSTDGGLTYPTVISAGTPNDGSEAVVMPATATTTARIKIEAADNVFFDISNANFTITAPVTGFDFSNPAPANVACNGPASASLTLDVSSISGFTTPVNLSASGNPAGTTVSFGTNPVTPGNSTVVTLNNTNTLSTGTYNITITGTAGTMTRTRVVSFVVQPGAAPTITTQPAPQQLCAGGNASFSVAATGAIAYQWQVSTDGTNFTNIGGATSATYTSNSVSASQNNYTYRVLVSGQCNTVTSNAAVLTVWTAPGVAAQPQSVTLCIGSNHSFSVTATGTNPTYQWQVSTDGGSNFTDIAGATAATLPVNGLTAGMNNNRYRVVISGTCAPPAISHAAVLTVISPVTVANHPVNVAVCENNTATFSVVGSGTGILYQWQVSTNNGASWNNIAGLTSSTMALTGVTQNMNGHQFRVLLSNATCTTPTASNAAVLTVYPLPSVSLSAAPSTRLFPGLRTTITATTNPAKGLTYTWYRNGVEMTGVTGNTHQVDVSGIGNYTVEVSDANGCVSPSFTLGIGDSASSQLFIYPNPNDGRFTISYFNSDGSTVRNVVVYDGKGAKVFEKSYPVTQAYQLLSVNMMPAASGIYMVLILDNNGKKIATGKVMIEHH